MGNERRLVKHGFSLVEMAIVLAIFGMMAGMLLPMLSATQETMRRKETRATFEILNEALAVFAMNQKRLPCPADGALLNDNPNYGKARPETASNVCDALPPDRQVLPWRTLGLSEAAAKDSWGERVRYRVKDGANGLTKTGSLSNSPPSTIDVFLQDKGLRLKYKNGALEIDTTSNPPATDEEIVAAPDKGNGAAYLLISYGRDGISGTDAADNLASYPWVSTLLKNAHLLSQFN